MFFGGNTPATAALLFNDVHAKLPSVKLFGSAGLADADFAAALVPDAQKLTYVTSPALAPRLYPSAGRRFFRDYREMYGDEPEPYAIYGYEAMKVVLDSIAAAGNKGNDRQAVTTAFFAVRERRSAIGTFSIDRDGDTSITDYAVYRVTGGKLVFDRVFKTT
jgi:branched-chain amino acid transport system substrate-binding protein